MKKLYIFTIMLFVLSLGLMGCDSIDEDLLDNLGSPTTESLERRIDDLQSQIDELQSEQDVLFATIGALEDIIFENERRLDDNYYTKEELNDIFTDYGLDINGVEDFVNMFDDFEDTVYWRIIELEQRISDLEITENTTYTQSQMEYMVFALLKDMVEIKYDNTIDIAFDEATQVFTLTEYNGQGEVFDVDIYTIDEIITMLTATVG